jgi:hypothetical protein
MSPAKRKLFAIAVVLATATALQVSPGGCARYGAYTALTAIDFCAIFNCEGGTFFNLCEPFPLFWDCPQLADLFGP